MRPVLKASLALTLTVACGAPSAPSEQAVSPEPAAPAAKPADDEAAVEARRLAELAHHVVAADRITYSYLLLVAGPPTAPTREELDKLVVEAFRDNTTDPEVELLRGMLATSPPAAGLDTPASPEVADTGRRAGDLLGLEIEAYPLSPPQGAPRLDQPHGAARLIDAKVLADPDLTRDLSPDERASLPGRTSLIVLRAAYRNQHAVRGLRLLQTLVRLLAARRGALIHDPDTLETVGPAVFTARRLQTSLGNVADQIPVIPFPDPQRPGMFRLATRGMRRFGVVDLELAGLPGDLAALQRATFFLHGLARVLIDLGEFDRAGFAVEIPEIVPVHHRDCASAYAGRPGSLPRCADCPEFVEVHLVRAPSATPPPTTTPPGPRPPSSACSAPDRGKHRDFRRVVARVRRDRYNDQTVTYLAPDAPSLSLRH
jgi:hypothetical protein